MDNHTDQLEFREKLSSVLSRIMKLPTRGIFAIIFFSIALFLLNVSYRSREQLLIREDEIHTDVGRITREEISQTLNKLAKNVNDYFDDFLYHYNSNGSAGISKEEMQHIVLRHLTANQNMSISSLEQLEEILTALKQNKITKSNNTTAGEESYVDHYNYEVALGRLSERYKVVSDILMDDNHLHDLQRILDNMSLARRDRVALNTDALRIHKQENDTSSITLPVWKRFQNAISRYQMYSEEDGLVDQLVNALHTRKISQVDNQEGGTEIKLVFEMEDGNRALFKPMRFPRDWDAWPDHYYFHDFERHVAEIAAFHLDRILGFRRVPPVSGRFVNVTSEIQYLTKDKAITDTIFISMAGNKCFYTTCEYYCDVRHAVCGRPHLLEGSMMQWLPSRLYIKRKEWENPWRRSYSKKGIAPWQKDPHYCDGVKLREDFKHGRRLLDVLDLTIFDFLTGNMDRHHFYTYYDRYGNDTFIITYDNGRGFGRSKHDEMSILTPLIQCCQIRLSTLETLISYETGGEKLSKKMERSLKKDVVHPILTEDHLKALDRRVRIVLREVHRCIETKKYFDVILDDGF